MGKGENSGNQHFLLFLQCFLPIPKRISVFILSSANAVSLDQSKILSFGKELNTLNFAGSGTSGGFENTPLARSTFSRTRFKQSKYNSGFIFSLRKRSWLHIYS